MTREISQKDVKYTHKPKIRVLHIYKTWSINAHGGVEKVITTLCQGAFHHEIEARIICLGDNTAPILIRQANFKGISFPRNFEIASTGFSTALFLNFKRVARWADILHFHFPWPFADLIHLCHKIKKPVIITYHSDIVRQRFLKTIYTPLMHRFLNRANVVVSTSQNYLNTSAILKKIHSKQKVIPIGIEDHLNKAIDLSHFSYWKNILGEGFILFLGVLRYYKGLHILLEAAKSIDCKIVIAGAGPIEKQLKIRANQLGIKNVFFISSVNEEDKDILFRLCSLFVFPSHLRSEAFGISLLEAAMYGKPLVSSEIGTGTSYINVNEVTGLVVEANNSLALSQSINRLLANPHERTHFGQNARERFETLFAADRMLNDYSELYREIYNG